MILIDGHIEKLWFKAGDKGTRVRKTAPTCIVLHHTAGEGGAHQVFNTLKRRGLSIHFVGDSDGRVTQMADLDTVCSHAGFMNGPSIGLEWVNRGVPPAIRGHLREVYKFKFRGRDRNFLAFYKRQTDALWEVLQGLCAQTGIPMVWPADQMVMPQEACLAYRGILGHHHITQKKIDPSPHVWDVLSQFRSGPQPVGACAPVPDETPRPQLLG